MDGNLDDVSGDGLTFLSISVPRHFATHINVLDWNNESMCIQDIQKYLA
jgi:hypothetical protein